jgi:uncharacterized protein YndB with AHSA1/START domain
MQFGGCILEDFIEKKILLHAPRERVWRAISDSSEFGSWFGMRFESPFIAGKTVQGVFSPTTVDPEVAAAHKPYEGMTCEMVIEEIEPQRLFSFRWHPYGVEPDVDYASEPMTLVVFTLEDSEKGVMLTVTESGFSKIPLERRARAFSANEGGWAMMLTLIEKFIHDAKQR